MIAILVIDLNEDVKIDELEIRYVIQDVYGTPVKAEVDGVKLKPMPKELEPAISEKYVDYCQGFNDCISEILGAEE